MIIDIEDLKVDLIDDEDRVVWHTKNLTKGKIYERDSLKWWAQNVKPHTTVIDVGAYTGIYSIIAALRGAEVIAYEPLPTNFIRLRQNVARNHVNVRMIKSAVSDYIGEGTLHYNRNVVLTTGASLEPGIGMHQTDIPVNVTTIDSLRLPDVSAMKIDVERHEPCVLRGAMQTIQRYRPSILIEILDEAKRAEVMKLLTDYEPAILLDLRNTLLVPR